MKRERDSLENVNVCTYFLNGADFLLLFLFFFGIFFLFFYFAGQSFGVFACFASFMEKDGESGLKK